MYQVKDVRRTFEAHRNADQAGPMKAYMKNRFDFLGIKSPERKEISRPFLVRSALPSEDSIWPLIKEFWELPEREYQYFAMELISKYNRMAKIDWLSHYEFMIITKSWWDTVDFIAASLVGNYFKIYADQIPSVSEKWMKSDNIWLQRTCLLFQLKYSHETNAELLTSFILPLASSKEFFIAKAIGWSLRQYSKFNPGWVKDFIESHDLQPLSRKEGLKIISRSASA